MAALVWKNGVADLNADGKVNNVDVRLQLQNTAQDLGVAGRDSLFGYGLVNATLAAPIVGGLPVADPVSPAAAPVNLALNRPVLASSIEGAGLEAAKAVDGSGTTRWASAFSDPQWVRVDLGSSQQVGRVVLKWEAAYGKSYKVQVSPDAIA